MRSSLPGRPSCVSGAVLAVALLAAAPGCVFAQLPAQQGIAFQIGIVPRHTHAGDTSGGGNLFFVAIMRSGNNAYGPVQVTTNTQVNLGNSSTTGTSGQDKRYSTVGGGLSNVSAGEATTISGGSGNQTVADGGTGAGDYSTISGGRNNRVAFQGSVGGGNGNQALGNNSTIPGGVDNRATGALSLAAGNACVASGSGTFALCDSRAGGLAIGASNYFAAQFENGYNFRGGGATFQSSVTATAFAGDGSALTALPNAEGVTFTSSKTFLTSVLVRGGLIAESTATVRGAFGVAGGSLTVRAQATDGVLFERTDAPSTMVTRLRGGGSLFAQLILAEGGSTTPLDIWTLNETGTNNLTFSTTVDRFTMTNAGNFGVGTISPAQSVHVASGGFLANGNASIPFQVGLASFVVRSNSWDTALPGTYSSSSTYLAGATLAAAYVTASSATVNGQFNVVGGTFTVRAQAVDGALFERTDAGSVMIVRIRGGGPSFAQLVFSENGSTTPNDVWTINETGTNNLTFTSTVDRLTLTTAGNLGLGAGTAPQEKLHVSSGVFLSDGINGGLRISSGATAGSLTTGVFVSSTSLDFANTAATTCDDLTITRTGSTPGDFCTLGVPRAVYAISAADSWNCAVTADNTVTVTRCCVLTVGNCADAPADLFGVKVEKITP